MEEKWYRADFDIVGIDDCRDEYFVADNDEDAIRIAKEYEAIGVDFVDVGHKDLELIQVVEVDAETECFNELRVVWY